MKKKTNSSRRPWRFQCGETVAQAMARAHLNAHQLHTLVPCSVQSAYNWANGNRPIDLYQMPLAKALNVKSEPKK